MTLLEARDLSLGYDGHSVVDHVSFQVDAGDYLCIIGDNGAGKSTLVKAVLSLNPPLSGQLTFNVDRRGIGYLPQSAMLDPGFPTSVEEVAISGAVSRLGRRFFYPKAERERALGNLERMGMLPFAHRPFQELSGGQRQRVLLARALTAASRILLLDEPSRGRHDDHDGHARHTSRHQQRQPHTPSGPQRLLWQQGRVLRLERGQGIPGGGRPP